MNMALLELSCTINAPVAKVWQALTDAKVAEKWGAGPAKVNAEVGGEFSYWNGDIHGTFTKILPGIQIVQDWYGHDNPEWKYDVIFMFEDNDGITYLRVLYSGNIVDSQRDTKDWQEYYFDPIKKLLEQS